MFKTRLISGIILLAIAAVAFAVGGPLLYGILLVISLIGLNELYRAAGVSEKTVTPLTAVGMAGAVLYYILVWLGASMYELPALALVLNILMAVYVFRWPHYESRQVMAAFFGIVYVPVMLSFIYKTRILNGGAFTVWLILVCSWGCDTCAYCVGMLFGKHKMAPVLSPKKSIEGAVGGVVGAGLLGALFGLIAGRFGGITAGMRSPIAEYALICVVGALISMIGDLAASAIKRNAGIKDYGKLIPGHGGILDRFDSVIFTAPVIWMLASLLLK